MGAALCAFTRSPYLVTVRHIAHQLGNDPFLIRVNLFDLTAENIYIDDAHWYFDSDPTIDVAVLQFDLLKESSRYDVHYIDDRRETWWWNKARKYGAGVGDFVYTVGLFRVLAGSERKCQSYISELSPGPYRGAIGLSWRDVSGVRTLETDGYLVEQQSLSGLSGAPVFIRASNLMVRPEMWEHNPGASAEDIGDAVAMWRLHLLGMWQGAWDAPVDHVLGSTFGREIRASIGMGVVVPGDHIHGSGVR